MFQMPSDAEVWGKQANVCTYQAKEGAELQQDGHRRPQKAYLSELDRARTYSKDKLFQETLGSHVLKQKLNCI